MTRIDERMDEAFKNWDLVEQYLTELKDGDDSHYRELRRLLYHEALQEMSLLGGAKERIERRGTLDIIGSTRM